jgi:hypothetical protein
MSNVSSWITIVPTINPHCWSHILHFTVGIVGHPCPKLSHHLMMTGRVRKEANASSRCLVDSGGRNVWKNNHGISWSGLNFWAVCLVKYLISNMSGDFP